MKKYKYYINNLDCAVCARVLEENLNNIEDLNNVVVNFSMSTISFMSNKKYKIEEINNLVKSIEPDCSISNIEDKNNKEYHLTYLIIGFILGIITYFLNINIFIKYILYIISYIFLLYRPIYNSYKLLKNKRGINENLLISISCIGALIIGEVLEGIMVITLYTIGKMLEELAVNKSRNSIKELMDIKVPFVTKTNNEQIPVENVLVGDLLIVKKGEKIPVDSVVLKGSSLIDTSSLTGESELVNVTVGDSLLSGCINTGDCLTIKATKVYEDSTVSKILLLLENATQKKAKTETTVTKISKIYTPLVLILAIIVFLFLPLISNITYIDSLYRGLTFLVISCPCAIVISIPLSYFTSIGVSGKNGILIKGSNYLDNISNISNIIFDKTGTLTNGSFKVSKIDIYSDNYTKDDIIDILINGEKYSTHPISKSILKLKDNYKELKVEDYKEIEGMGISYKIDNMNILVGNSKLCKCKKDAILHLNINNIHVASITIDDGIKDDSKEVISYLKDNNINTYMFTGDKQEVAKVIAKKLDIDNYEYEMLPQDKYTSYESISNRGGITAFVGDGINDAPVLKRADIGISLGSIGSDQAIEASDIVLMSDELIKIPLLIKISKYTKRIIKQNLIFAIFIKILILILSIFGLANMWWAVFADTGVTLLTILNTLRIINKFNRKD